MYRIVHLPHEFVRSTTVAKYVTSTVGNIKFPLSMILRYIVNYSVFRENMVYSYVKESPRQSWKEDDMQNDGEAVSGGGMGMVHAGNLFGRQQARYTGGLRAEQTGPCYMCFYMHASYTRERSGK